MTNLDSILKSKDSILPTKVHLVKVMVFPCMYHVWMWELDCKESWAPKSWCFWTVVLEKTLKSPLDWKEIQSVHLKENQSWIFVGRNVAEAETPILWPPYAKNWLIWKDSDAGEDWGLEKKGTTEDEMVGWHHQHNVHGFGWFRELVMDREAWHAPVHGVAKSRTWLSNWTELRQHIKKQRCYFADKCPSSQSYGFFSNHIWMWELDHKEGWALKNWCFWTVMLEKTLESPLDCKEIKPVNPKGYKPWIFIGRTEAEAEAPVLWSPDVKGQLFGKDPEAGKHWRPEEKGTTEDEMVGWHHQHNGREFDQAPGDEGQGSLVCCSPWGHKELDVTE